MDVLLGCHVLWVAFVDIYIYMCKMEHHVVETQYSTNIGNTYVRRKRNTKDELFEKLNIYHENIKLTIKENLTKFLGREIVRHNPAIITKVCTRSKKFPVYWSSKIPLRYKRNAIIRELHRSNKVMSNFSSELKRIKIRHLQTSKFASSFQK